MRYILTILVLLSSTLVIGQQRHLSIIINSKVAETKDYSTQLALNKSLKEYINNKIENGFLLTSIDSLASKNDSTWAYLYLGNQFKWAQLTIDSNSLKHVSPRSLKHIRPTLAITPSQFHKFYESTIIDLENNGFPFAQIKLEHPLLTDSSISGVVTIKPFQLVTIDSLIIEGTATINDIYIENLIHINEGSLYSEQKTITANEKINNVSFLKSSKPPTVLFTNEGTWLTLFVDKKKANKFNGIIGILPTEDDKTLITGDIDLLLNNALGAGERISLNWKKLQTNTVRLNAQASYPYLLNTPFGLTGDLSLYRKDTLFQNLNYALGVQYLFTPISYLKGYFSKQQSTLLGNFEQINSSGNTSSLDLSTNIYGIELVAEKLDYKFNPRKGISINFTSGAGTKTIVKNPKINEEVYDSLDLKSTQVTSTLIADAYIPFATNLTLNIGLQSATIINQKLFTNELYRIGGLNSLRGFDEESIFASSYAIGTLETRYLLEKNSYAFLFFDMAYYENRVNNTIKADTPFGFGAGLTFETNAGVFSLTYALGYEQNQLSSIRSGKIHFGFISFF